MNRGIVYENLSRELSTPSICDEHGKFTKILNFRKRYYQILNQAGMETKGLHSLCYTFVNNLVNRVKQANGTIRALSSKQVADLLRHSPSQITEKKDASWLTGVTDGFEIWAANMIAAWEFVLRRFEFCIAMDQEKAIFVFEKFAC